MERPTRRSKSNDHPNTGRAGESFFTGEHRNQLKLQSFADIFRRSGGYTVNDIDEIRSRYREILQPAKVRGTYICPLCGNGSGEDGDGIRENPNAKKPGSLKCFKCGFSGSIIDLYKEQNRCTVREALESLRTILNISPDAQNRPVSNFKTKGGENIAGKEKSPQEDTRARTGADYTEYYRQCAERITNRAAVSYLQARGISLETARRFGLGYDPQADPAGSPGEITNAPRRSSEPRIIIPATKYFYTGRAIRPGAKVKYANPKGSAQACFNTAALDRSGVLFVAEGSFDALAIIEAGAEATATNGALNTDIFLQVLKDHHRSDLLILCKDHDTGEKPAGDMWEVKLTEGLKALNLPFLTADLTGDDCKDCNEALQKDPEAFKRRIKDILERAATMNTENTENTNTIPDAPDTGKMTVRSISEYLNTGTFDADIRYFKEYKDRKTGFLDIDEHLTLYPGLAVLGGASSLGKTTFAVNLAENLIERGETVLFISLEQLPIEIITKSLTRRLFLKDPATRLTNTDIKNGATSAAVEAVKKECADQATRFNIITGDFMTKATTIRETVEQWIRDNGGKKPIVIIDYLQLIAPPEHIRADMMRSVVDENLKTLKLMQRDNELFVLVISSFNRAESLEPLSYEAYKESGMIEFTCDYVWGLQYKVQRADNDSFYLTEGSSGKGLRQTTKQERRKIIEQEQTKTPRQIQFVSLKSRNGRQRYDADFDYYPQFDLYRDVNPFDDKQPKSRSMDIADWKKYKT